MGSSNASSSRSAARKSLPVTKASRKKTESEGINFDTAPAMAPKGSKQQKKAEVNYDELPALGGRSSERQASRVAVNYDDLPALTGRTNFANKTEDSNHPDAGSGQHQDLQTPQEPFSFNRNDLLKSFVMAEVLQRYNIERIYDRIPGIKSDD